MSGSYLNGVVVKEAIELKSTIDAANPVIGPNEMQLSYDSIDPITGVYIGVRARVGPGNWLDCTEVFNNTGSNKLPKSGTMLVDYAFDYTITSGDIAALGTNIIVGQVIVNGALFFANVTYSSYPLTAGDRVTLSGLPLMADVTSLNFILQ